ncbi:MAG: CD1375 family protein [Enterocloster sp.]
MLRLLLFLLLRKEVETMAIIYATLIVKGKKTYAQVPEKIKPQVQQVLIDLECEDLITEE